MRRALIAAPAAASGVRGGHPRPRRHGDHPGSDRRDHERRAGGDRPEPFRISFQDRSGRTLLREVHNREPAGRPLPLTRDPEPFALEREPDNASYSPLGFELGRERRAQWNAGFWNGDMLFSRRYGSAHFAHRVLNAIPIRRRRSAARCPPARGAGCSSGWSRTWRARSACAPGCATRPGVISMADSFVAAPR